ncbi:uncharacterized protein LOC132271031 isoform X2 [Cornus florida]|uniref:uncharacterized protein LOC132271031 isoform X2 n=1 Tax=Cornus florida TaxID=4283 RepID=UPI00289FE973|nr:uncharacterized protein LOC132271031 isoform X2 [Cornus florida]
MLNTRCSPNKFKETVCNLSEDKKVAVQEIGFGSLLDIECTILKRNLCLWLVEHFDPRTSHLTLESGARIHVTPSDVEEVLGLPSGRGEDVPNYIVQSVHWLENGIFLKDGVIEVPNLVHQLDVLPVGDDFKRAFVLFACGSLLAPISKNETSKRLLAAVDNVDAIKSYNWGKFVLDWLKKGIASYKGKEGREGCTYIHGCLFFLMLFYLHRVDVNGPKPKPEMSCVRGWTNKLIGERLNLEKHKYNGFGFGEVKFTTDTSEDADKELAYEIIKVVKKWKQRHNVGQGRGSRSSEPSSSTRQPNPSSQLFAQHNPIEEEDESHIPVEEEFETSTRQANSPWQSFTKHDPMEEEGEIPAPMEEEVGTSTAMEEERDVQEAVIPLLRVIKPGRHKGSPWVEMKVNRLRVLRPEAKAVISYAMDESRNDDEMLVNINDIFLTRKEMRTISYNHWISNMVVEVYCQMLQLKQKRRGTKIFFPPSIGIELSKIPSKVVDRKGKIQAVWNNYKRIRNVDDNKVCQFNMLFFPILVNEKHWCLYVFNICDSRMDVLDSNKHSSHDKRTPDKMSKDLVMLVEVFTGRDLQNFIYNVPNVPQQPDSDSCGAFMLDFMEKWDGSLSHPKEKVDVDRLRAIIASNLLSDDNNTMKDFVKNKALYPFGQAC